MCKYKPSFISFAEARLQSQGDEIRAWAKSSNPLLAQTCKDIIEAAGKIMSDDKETVAPQSSFTPSERLISNIGLQDNKVFDAPCCNFGNYNSDFLSVCLKCDLSLACARQTARDD